MQFSALPCYLVPLRSQYPPQHPVPKHPQPTFLSQCQLPSFTPIQTNRQNNSFVYLQFLFLNNNLEDSRLYTE